MSLLMLWTPSTEVQINMQQICELILKYTFSAHCDYMHPGIWVKQSIAPTALPFTGNSGLQMPLPDDPTPLDYLKLFFNEDFFEYLVTETNRYARAFIDANLHTLPARSFARSWKPVVVGEMKVFLGLST
eukprot:scpid41094/ scgid23460/ 